MSLRSGLDKDKNMQPGLVFTGTADKTVEWTEQLMAPIVQKDCYGGHGLAGSAVSYFKILMSLLRDDEIILKKSTTAEMFKPQISPQAAHHMCTSLICSEASQGTFNSQAIGQKLNWGLGGLLIEEDIEGGKKKGCLTWSGLPNLLWSVDKEEGLACLYAGNVFPFGDKKSHEMQQEFERDMYRRVREI